MCLTRSWMAASRWCLTLGLECARPLGLNVLLCKLSRVIGVSCMGVYLFV